MKAPATELAQALTGASTRSYYDPSLWLRMVPAIQERQKELAQGILAGRWTTLEQARDMIGEARGLQWVMDTAAELTRIEEKED